MELTRGKFKTYDKEGEQVFGDMDSVIEN